MGLKCPGFLGGFFIPCLHSCLYLPFAGGNAIPPFGGVFGMLGCWGGCRSLVIFPLCFVLGFSRLFFLCVISFKFVQSFPFVSSVLGVRVGVIYFAYAGYFDTYHFDGLFFTDCEV